MAGAIALFTVGCGGVAQEGDRAELHMDQPKPDSRLAALPHVPASPRVHTFPPELSGLTFRAIANMDGATGEQASSERAQRCIANIEEWMGAAGWTPIRDPQAPADLVIEEHCVSGLSMRPAGRFVEMGHAESQTVAIVVLHDGAPLVTVPRGPADYVCESSGTRQQTVRDCEARSELWAQAQIIEALIASQPLAELAQRLRSQR